MIQFREIYLGIGLAISKNHIEKSEESMKNMYNILTVASVLALSLSGCGDRTKKGEKTFKDNKKQTATPNIEKVRADVDTILSNYEVTGDLNNVSELEDETSEAAKKSLVKVVYYPKHCSEVEAGDENEPKIELSKKLKKIKEEDEAASNKDEEDSDREEDLSKDKKDKLAKKVQEKKQKEEAEIECIDNSEKVVTTGVIVKSNQTVLTSASQLAELIASRLHYLGLRGDETSAAMIAAFNKGMSIAIYNEKNELKSLQAKIRVNRDLNLYVSSLISGNKRNADLPTSNFIVIQTKKPVGTPFELAPINQQKSEKESETLVKSKNIERKIEQRDQKTLFASDEEFTLIGFMDSEKTNLTSDYSLVRSSGKILNQNICTKVVQSNTNGSSEDLKRVENNSHSNFFFCLSSPANDELQGSAIVNKSGQIAGIFSGVSQSDHNIRKRVAIINSYSLNSFVVQKEKLKDSKKEEIKSKN